MLLSRRRKERRRETGRETGREERDENKGRERERRAQSVELSPFRRRFSRFRLKLITSHFNFVLKLHPADITSCLHPSWQRMEYTLTQTRGGGGWGEEGESERAERSGGDECKRRGDKERKRGEVMKRGRVMDSQHEVLLPAWLAASDSDRCALHILHLQRYVGVKLLCGNRRPTPRFTSEVTKSNLIPKCHLLW